MSNPFEDHATPDDLIAQLRKAIDGRKVSAWAAENGVSQGYIADVLSGRRPLGPKIAEALGYHGEPIILYQPLPQPAAPKASEAVA